MTDDLARRQRELVAALTGTGEHPHGFDPGPLEAARNALLVKRARELTYAWPILSSSLGERLVPAFREFAAHRPTKGIRRDGHDFALWLRERGKLPLAAHLELAENRLYWRYPPPDAPAHQSPQRNTKRVVIEPFPGGRLVRIGQRVRSYGRPKTDVTPSS